MRARIRVVAVVLGICGSLCAAYAGETDRAVFTAYTPLSENTELARRFMTPLEAAQLPSRIAQSGVALRDQPIDLSKESFALYVPATKPANGYGLVVFVPPWDEAYVPPAWKDTLEQFGIIFVSAARSGNAQSVLGRREPLALLAEANATRAYPVDPKRIYIGGFSGGARVALRIALAYPDVFGGVILNSGSDPIGTHDAPLPTRELLRQFQDSTRLVYMSGDDDRFIRQTDFASRRSLDGWCVFHVETIAMPSTGHALADSASLSRAVEFLQQRPNNDGDRMASCRAGIEAALREKLDGVRSLIVQGRREDAKTLLNQTDTRYGGFAAPQSLELASELPAP